MFDKEPMIKPDVTNKAIRHGWAAGILLRYYAAI
jgi:hypothetical protein